MRRCCCCSVKTGAVLLGLLNLLIPALVSIPLVGFLTKTQVPGLNFIQDNYKVLEMVVEDSLRGHEWTSQHGTDIMAHLRAAFPAIVLAAAVYSGVTALFSFLMVLGVRCETRCLMVPFLVLSMLDIMSMGAAGVVVVVALFHLATVPGAVSLVVYVMLAVVSLYSWAVVLAAYREVGSEEYTYNPVVSGKAAEYHRPEYYPSAPQHFVMEEYRDLRDQSHH